MSHQCSATLRLDNESRMARPSRDLKVFRSLATTNNLSALAMTRVLSSKVFN